MTVLINPDVLTPEDYERIGTIKKAADVVYDYVQWATEDHSRTLVEKEHQAKISSVIDEITLIFGGQVVEPAMVRYFIANVASTVVRLEEAQTNIKHWHVLSDGNLRDIYVQEEVVACCLAKPNHHDIAMFAGVFMSKATSGHEKLPKILEGELVGGDSLFSSTNHWRSLIDQSEEDSDTSAEAVGHALVASVNSAFDLNAIEDFINSFSEG